MLAIWFRLLQGNGRKLNLLNGAHHQRKQYTHQTLGKIMPCCSPGFPEGSRVSDFSGMVKGLVKRARNSFRRQFDLTVMRVFRMNFAWTHRNLCSCGIFEGDLDRVRHEVCHRDHFQVWNCKCCGQFLILEISPGSQFLSCHL